jgi:hypothetical protein
MVIDIVSPQSKRVVFPSTAVRKIQYSTQLGRIG